jgi:hypothetical protein
MAGSKRNFLAVTPVALSIVCGLGGCSPKIADATHADDLSRPVASLQELMQTVIDPSADGVWNAVETVSTRAGDEVRAPKSPEEWLEVRRAAITLIEGSNLLMMKGRVVGRQFFPAEASGALDSTQIQERIGASRAAFAGFAVALREAGVSALEAVDAKDPVALVKSGGALDEVCEGCHLSFWYPNQVIPAFPSEQDASRPIFRSGVLKN